MARNGRHSAERYLSPENIPEPKVDEILAYLETVKTFLDRPEVKPMYSKEAFEKSPYWARNGGEYEELNDYRTSIATLDFRKRARKLWKKLRFQYLREVVVHEPHEVPIYKITEQLEKLEVINLDVTYHSTNTKTFRAEVLPLGEVMRPKSLLETEVKVAGLMKGVKVKVIVALRVYQIATEGDVYSSSENLQNRKSPEADFYVAIFDLLMLGVDMEGVDPQEFPPVLDLTDRELDEQIETIMRIAEHEVNNDTDWKHADSAAKDKEAERRFNGKFFGRMWDHLQAVQFGIERYRKLIENVFKDDRADDKPEVMLCVLSPVNGSRKIQEGLARPRITLRPDDDTSPEGTHLCINFTELFDPNDPLSDWDRPDPDRKRKRRRRKNKERRQMLEDQVRSMLPQIAQTLRKMRGWPEFNALRPRVTKALKRAQIDYKLRYRKPAA